MVEISSVEEKDDMRDVYIGKRVTSDLEIEG